MQQTLALALLATGSLTLGGMSFSQEAKNSQAEPASVDPLWRFQTTGEIWSTAVMGKETLYFGSDDNSLYAVNPTKGSLRWRHSTGGRVRSTPAIDDGRVYFTSDDGFLHAVTCADGTEAWRFDLESSGIDRNLPSIFPPYQYDYLQSSPLLVDGVLYTGSANGHLYAVDSESGKQKWKFETAGRIRSSPRAEGDSVFIGSWDGHVYCLDRNTGAERWKFDTGGILQGSPTIGGGRVFIGSRNPKVFALDASTGKLEWEFAHKDGSWVESTGVLRDGILYIGSSDACALFAFEADSGKLLNKFHTGSWSWGMPAVTEDTVLIGGVGASPYYVPGVTLTRGLWAIDRVSGKQKWHLATGELPSFLNGGVFATPLVADGVAYFGSLDGGLYAVSLKP